MLSLVRLTFLGSLSGFMAGLASALFLASLAWVTTMQRATPPLLWLLPIGGVGVAAFYHHLGGLSRLGNNLILEEARASSRPVPFRMAPLVLFGTLITHLFGGSAGREGTAVQMSGSLTDSAARWLRLSPNVREISLQASIAAGFASVFGTPFAGTVFALEVLRNRRRPVRWTALFPSLVAAWVGDSVTRLFVSHTEYIRPVQPTASLAVILKVAMVGIAFGAAAILFVEALHGMKRLFSRLSPYPPMGALIGGTVVIGLTLLIGTRDYNGLGIPMIEAAVAGEALNPAAFFLKTVLTAITLGSGYQGGEVTPLFFVGATLGNALGQLTDLSPGFLAALGFVAVFAGAVNAPLACVVMGAELFGIELWPYLAIACFVSHLVSGRRSIYTSQLETGGSLSRDRMKSEPRGQQGDSGDLAKYDE